jgi:putative peptidoglycan lipid II flippase
MRILRSVTTVGGYTMGSRIFGFVRDQLAAAILGAGPAMDALVIAIKLPSLLRRLLAEGTLNAAFVPIFAKIFEQEGQEQAKSFAEEVLSLLIIVLSVTVFFVEILMPWIMPLCAPGFVNTPDRLSMAIEFSRYTFPFIFFISITALYSGILNSFEKFVVAASSPMIGNIFIIALVGAFHPLIQDPGSLFAVAITGCGIVQLLWVLLPCHRNTMTLRIKMPRITPRVKRLLKVVAPVALSSGVHQINILVGTMIASYLSIGGVTYLYYAERLTQLPLSVVGTAMSTVLLPLLARQIKSGRIDDAKESQVQGIEFAMLLTFPAMIGLVVLAEPIIRVLFERGAFDYESSQQTSFALMAYALGLPAYVLTKIFTTCFYAQEDTTTPLIFSFVSVGVDVLLAFALYKPFAHVGIAAATAAAAWAYAFCLGFALKQRGFFAISSRLKLFMGRLSVTCVATFCGLYLGKKYLAFALSGIVFEQTLTLAILIAGGVVTFFTFSKFTGVMSIRELRLQFQSPTKE